MPLTETECRHAKPRERAYKMADGGGLYLFVQPSGSRLWRMAYRFGGKQKTLAFGAYPYVTLGEARKRRTEAKTALAAGRDPGVKQRAAESFEALARRWYAAKAPGWAESNASRVWSRIERDLLPPLGAKAVTAIEPMDLLDALRAVEDRGSVEVAKRLKQAAAGMFRLAIAEGALKYNPAADIGDGLRPAARPKHRATLRPEHAQQLARDIAGYQGEPVTRLALLVALHTFVRTNELRLATWAEIEGDTWRVPAERMKMRREHLVPLSPAVLALLEELRPHRVGDWIFPGQRGPLSNNTMLYGLYRAGYHSRQTVHGFRRLASTTLHEAGFDTAHVEMQLAHADKNEIRSIYNAAEWIKPRRTMMDWWSIFLAGDAKLDI